MKAKSPTPINDAELACWRTKWYGDEGVARACLTDLAQILQYFNIFRKR
jgi:hypothetical protein